jgi:hypothetical protein
VYRSGYPISDRNIVGQERTTVPELYITGFCGRVIQMALLRVHSGMISERALARRAGISQPHLHNALKGIRTLSPEATDRLMRALNVTIPQILWAAGGFSPDEVRAVPLLRDRIGPGTAASFGTYRGYMPFPAGLVRSLTDPLAGYLAADLALPGEYLAGDLVLLDQNPTARTALPASSCWVVVENTGVRVRYVRRVHSVLEVAGTLAGSGDWHQISLRGVNVLDIVRARIVWIGREMETPLARPTEPSGAGD